MKFIPSSFLTVALLSITLPVMAVNHSMPPSTNSAETKLTHKQKITDEKTLGIMMAVDQSEIAAANIAMHKHINASVLYYAKDLHKQHSKHLQEIQQFAKTNHLTPMQSNVSKTITKESKADAKKLNALNGKSFEMAYVKGMVKGHEGGLKLIDTKLLKHATNKSLHSFVESFRRMVAHHLEKARELQANL